MSNGHHNNHMRNNQKRMRGRHNNNHHRKSQNPLTRVYESNGPDVKIRGTASHVAEKYIQLARDSQSSGDPVAAENYYQHAEHYFRLIAAAQEQFRQQNTLNPQQPQQTGGMPQQGAADNYDDDGDDQPMQGQNEPHAPRGDQPQPYMQQNAQPFPPRDQQPQQGGRPQHQQNYQPRPQQQGGYNNQGGSPEGQEMGGLPSFITGGQPQNNGGAAEGQNQGGNNSNDHYNDRGPNRFGRHRRRHRGPRHDMQGGQSNQSFDQGNGPEGGSPNQGNDGPREQGE